MFRKLLIALSLVFISCLAHAQTTISASDVSDSFDHPIAAAKLCFAPVDATGAATGFRVGSTQVVSTPVCGLVSNGVLQSGLTVVPTPSGIYYHITAQNRTSGAVIRDYGMTQITGDSWTLDTYDPSTAVLPVSAITMGTVTTLPPDEGASCDLSGTSPILLNCSIPQGTAGATGAAGSVTATGTNGNFLVPGAVQTGLITPPPPTRFWCEGDSITAGVNVSTPSHRYCDVAMTLPSLSSSGATYTNAAVAGSQTTDMIARYTSNGTKAACQAGGTLLHVAIGTNDLGNGGLTAAASFANMVSYWNQAKTDGCILSVSTILPRSDSSWTPAMETQRQLLNEMIRASTIPNYIVDFDAVIHDSSSSYFYYASTFGATTTANSTTVVVPSGVASGVSVSEAVDLLGAGASGADLITTVTAVNTGTNTLTLADAPAITSSSVELASPVNGAGLHPSDPVHLRMAQTLDAALRGAKQVAWLYSPGAMPSYPSSISLPSGTDLDTVTACGTYDINGMVNGPPSASSTPSTGNSWIHLQVLCTSATTPSGWTAQLAYNLLPWTFTDGSTGSGVWYRAEDSGTFPAWTQIYPAGAAVLASTLLTSGTDLNTITACGIYDGTGLTDTPAAIGTNWLHMLDLCADSSTASSYNMQFATGLTEDYGVFYRINNGTWNSFTLNAGTTGSIGGSAVAAGACATGTATVPNISAYTLWVGASPGFVGGPGAGFVWTAQISGAGTVTVDVCNITSGSLTPTAGVYNVRAN